MVKEKFNNDKDEELLCNPKSKYNSVDIYNNKKSIQDQSNITNIENLIENDDNKLFNNEKIIRMINSNKIEFLKKSVNANS